MMESTRCCCRNETLPASFRDYNTRTAEEEKEKDIIREKIFPESNFLYQLRFAVLLKEFSEAPTNEARMQVAAKYFSILGEDNYIEQRFREVENKTNFKDSTKSEQLRTQGNTEYGKREDKKALELYTKSIAYAPQDSSELHLAYANRSAVLRSMKKCRECLVDVERALSLGYPRDKSFKLLLREMQCHRDLGNIEQMNASCQRAEILLQSLTGLTEKEVAALKKQLDGERKASPKEVCTETVIFPKEVPELSYGESSEIVGASSAVRIAYTEQQGRHLVADRDINIGDVLLIKENIVGALIDQHKYDHCAHCHQPCYNLLPCHNCVWVMFCSDKCQSEANMKYHSAECAPFSRICHTSGKLFLGVFDRLMRFLAMIGIDKLQPYLKYARTKEACMSKEARRTKGFNSQGVFDPANFETVFNLVSMMEHQDQGDLLMNSAFLLQIPRCFRVSMKDPDFYAVAGLCLQLQDTASLANLTNPYYIFKSAPMAVVGPADCISPLGSLVNHACFCNITSVQYASKHVTYAKWPISKGSILTESYNNFELTCPKEQRQEMLKKLSFFDCKCEACENDWKFKTCISDPADQELANELCRFEENAIVLSHTLLPESHLTPLFETFKKNRHEFLTKMWEKGEFLDVRCQYLQYQLMVNDMIQGNRIMNSCPYKNSTQVASHNEREELALVMDLITCGNLK